MLAIACYLQPSEDRAGPNHQGMTRQPPNMRLKVTGARQ